MTKAEKEQIQAMRRQGISYVKISEQLGISDSTVRSFCRRSRLEAESMKIPLCPQCGKQIKIVPKQKPKKFCSDTCRLMWWREHPDALDKAAVYSFVCPVCGRPFTAYGNKNRKFCSHACYIISRFGKEVRA